MEAVKRNCRRNGAFASCPPPGSMLSSPVSSVCSFLPFGVPSSFGKPEFSSPSMTSWLLFLHWVAAQLPVTPESGVLAEGESLRHQRGLPSHREGGRLLADRSLDTRSLARLPGSLEGREGHPPGGALPRAQPTRELETDHLHAENGTDECGACPSASSPSSHDMGSFAALTSHADAQTRGSVADLQPRLGVSSFDPARLFSASPSRTHAPPHLGPSEEPLTRAFRALVRSLTEPIEKALQTGDTLLLRAFLSPLTAETENSAQASHPLSFYAFSQRHEARAAMECLRETLLTLNSFSSSFSSSSFSTCLSLDTSPVDSSPLPSVSASLVPSLGFPALATWAVQTAEAFRTSDGSAGSGKRGRSTQESLRACEGGGQPARSSATTCEQQRTQSMQADTGGGRQTAEETAKQRDAEDQDVERGVLGESSRLSEPPDAGSGSGRGALSSPNEEESEETESGEAKRRAALRVFLDDRVFVLTQIAAVKIAACAVASVTAAAVDDLLNALGQHVSPPASSSLFSELPSSCSVSSATRFAASLSAASSPSSRAARPRVASRSPRTERGAAAGREETREQSEEARACGAERERHSNILEDACRREGGSATANPSQAKANLAFLDCMWWQLLLRIHELLEVTRAFSFASSPLVSAGPEEVSPSQLYPPPLAALGCRVKRERDAAEDEARGAQRCRFDAAENGRRLSSPRAAETGSGTGQGGDADGETTNAFGDAEEEGDAVEDGAAERGDEGRAGREGEGTRRGDMRGGDVAGGGEVGRSKEGDGRYLEVRERIFRSMQILGQLLRSLKKLQMKALGATRQASEASVSPVLPSVDQTSSDLRRGGIPCSPSSPPLGEDASPSAAVGTECAGLATATPESDGDEREKDGGEEAHAGVAEPQGVSGILEKVDSNMRLLCASIGSCFERWPSMPPLQMYDRLLLPERSNSSSSSSPSPSSSASSASRASSSCAVSCPCSSSSASLQPLRAVDSEVAVSAPSRLHAASPRATPALDGGSTGELTNTGKKAQERPAVVTLDSEERADRSGEQGDGERGERSCRDGRTEREKDVRDLGALASGEEAKGDDKRENSGKSERRRRSEEKAKRRQTGKEEGGTWLERSFACEVERQRDEPGEEGDVCEEDWCLSPQLHQLVDSAKHRADVHVFVEENVFFLLSHLHQVASEHEEMAAAFDLLAKQGAVSPLFLLSGAWTPWREIRELRLGALVTTQAKIRELWAEKDLWRSLLDGMQNEAQRRGREARERREGEREERTVEDHGGTMGISDGQASGKEGDAPRRKEAVGDVFEPGKPHDVSRPLADAPVREQRIIQDSGEGRGREREGDGDERREAEKRKDLFEGERGGNYPEVSDTGNAERMEEQWNEQAEGNANERTDFGDGGRGGGSTLREDAFSRDVHAAVCRDSSSAARDEAGDPHAWEGSRGRNRGEETQLLGSQTCDREEEPRGRQRALSSCEPCSLSTSSFPFPSFRFSRSPASSSSASPSAFSSAVASSSRGLREALLAFWSWGGSGDSREETRRPRGLAAGPAHSGRGGGSVATGDGAAERQTAAKEGSDEDAKPTDDGEAGSREERGKRKGGDYDGGRVDRQEGERERKEDVAREHAEAREEGGGDEGGVSGEKGDEANTEDSEDGEADARREEERGGQERERERGEATREEADTGKEEQGRGSEDEARGSEAETNRAIAEGEDVERGKAPGTSEGDDDQDMEEPRAGEETRQSQEDEGRRPDGDRGADEEEQEGEKPAKERRKRQRPENSEGEEEAQREQRSERADAPSQAETKKPRGCRPEVRTDDEKESEDETDEDEVPAHDGHDLEESRKPEEDGEEATRHSGMIEAEVDDETALCLSSCFWESETNVVVSDALLSAAADLITEPQKRTSSPRSSPPHSSSSSSSSSSSLSSAVARASLTVQWKETADVKPRSLLDPHPGERREEWDSDSVDTSPERVAESRVRSRGKKGEGGTRAGSSDKENSSVQEGRRLEKRVSWTSSDDVEERRREADKLNAASKRYRKYREAVGDPDLARQILNARHPGAGPVCRPQRKWEAADEQLLVAGVNMFGVGKWNEVHKFFPPLRRFSPPQLKDKFRILQKLLHVCEDTYRFIE
ncbi:UNVERIFIED_CONTAM: hypothetical protein HHA_259860 [Hammondia hammondi]|eukprot:XP_008883051.1 hypothetical protein HHA_259860 [Hammondia hammondi]